MPRSYATLVVSLVARIEYNCRLPNRAPQDPPHSPSSTDSLLEAPSDKSIRVKYHGAGPHSPHDLSIDYGCSPVDVALVLPHFRARNQPLNHRMSMFVGNESADDIKVKIVSLGARL